MKWYKKLSSKRERLSASAFLVEGPRAIGQVIASAPNSIIEILSIEQPNKQYTRYPTRLITESQLKSICSTQHPQGLVAVVRLPENVYSSNISDSIGSRILLLEDVQDPGNVGTLIRTAAAFDFSGVILTQKCADPFSLKCVQASAGTVLSLWIRVAGDYVLLVKEFNNSGYTLVAADLDGLDDASSLNSVKLILALGNEASGLTSSVLDIADFRLKIPVNNRKAESLNVAACGAICMYLSSR